MHASQIILNPLPLLWTSHTQEKRSLYTCLDGTHIYTVFTRLD